MQVAVVDYGVNNVGSVVNMFRRLLLETTVVRTPEQLQHASALVLPGIGAFDAGVHGLRQTGLFDAIRERVADGVPILGICLGMQLLTRGSEEGKAEGLGLIGGETKRIRFDDAGARLKVPHMGWNRTSCRDGELFAGLDDARFYYVHSYHVVCDDPADVVATCVYGATLTGAVRSRHVMGTQFHPEKSHRYGLTVLANYGRMVGAMSPEVPAVA